MTLGKDRVDDSCLSKQSSHRSLTKELPTIVEPTMPESDVREDRAVVNGKCGGLEQIPDDDESDATDDDLAFIEKRFGGVGGGGDGAPCIVNGTLSVPLTDDTSDIHDDESDESDDSDDYGAFRLNHSYLDTRNVSLMNDSFKIVSLLGLIIWVLLVVFVYRITPKENIVMLGDLENITAIIAAALLAGSMGQKILPMLMRNGAERTLRSGIIVGAIVVQGVAVITDVMLATMAVPVVIDSVTGARVYPLRYCEWAPLAFVMTFFTEGANVPKDEVDEVNTWKSKCHHAWKVLRAPTLLGVSQGVSTLMGVFFPYLPNTICWIIAMLISFGFYLTMFPRLFFRQREFEKMEEGDNVDEEELYNRVRLSYKLMYICTVMWTLVVASYFFSSFAPWFVPAGSVMTLPSLPFICDVVLDVVTKALYMDVIADMHHAVFDDAGRTSRRMEEVKGMMSVVWECSTDVIAISIKGDRGGVTNMISPAFHRIEALAEGEDISVTSRGTHQSKKKPPIVFDMTPDDLFVPSCEIDLSRKRLRRMSFASLFSNSSNDLKSLGEKHDKESNGGKGGAAPEPPLPSLKKLLARAWNADGERLLSHVFHIQDGEKIRCEAKITRMGDNALVVVVRDVSERFDRFEAEKRAVSQWTARKKDSEANKFTRHEVKNGLLASLALCDSMRETFSEERHRAAQYYSSVMKKNGVTDALSHPEHEKSFDYMGQLDKALRRMLDTILAEAMVRDIIHEIYEPLTERVDLEALLGGNQTEQEKEKFPVLTNPSPLPQFLLDPQLVRFIHVSAVSNACKFGKDGGVVRTEIYFCPRKREIEVKVINLPGNDHKRLLGLDFSERENMFEPCKRRRGSFDMFSGQNHASRAWISRKGARTIGGDCSLFFHEDKTIFSLKFPGKPCHVIPRSIANPSGFQLPDDIWGVALDDCKIQRKLMGKFFIGAGIRTERHLIVGKDADEIRGFDDQVVELIESNPTSYFLIIVDENLDISYSGDGNHSHTISGSLCIQKVRNRLQKFDEERVLALVRSANDSASDVAIYKSRAHGFINKAPIKKDKICEVLGPAWTERFESL